jgi:hypothetical protein
MKPQKIQVNIIYHIWLPYPKPNPGKITQCNLWVDNPSPAKVKTINREL